jgi:signal transduction histidine kinase
MFHSAALKLTVWYLAIIMLLSISFSLAIYHISSADITRNNRRQTYFLNDRLPSPNVSNFSQLRQQDLNEGMSHLKANLLVFNLLVLVAGGAASYALARRTLEPIELALDAQKRFTGDASHELRTPLTIMQTENEVALRDPKLTKQEAVKQLKSNLEEVAKLKSLSDGLLRLSSYEPENITVSSLNWASVVKQALERWAPVADSKKIDIKSELADVFVRGDSDSLRELVSVLIDNAIKYSPDEADVSISLHRVGKNAQLKVSDHGDGIAASDLPRIFDRFYQADTARSGGRGYGLGLSIARRIVELHNGSIEVASAPKRGSSFTVTIPAA